MSRDHQAFAAELREDARILRQMADSLDRRAAEQDRLAREDASGFPSAFVMNMDEAQHHAWMRSIRRREARQRSSIDEDHCAFGLRYVGSSTAPRREYI